MKGTVMVSHMWICLPMYTVISTGGFTLQILMSAQRTLMVVGRRASTQMVPFSVPVEMGFVLAMMGGAVLVSLPPHALIPLWSLNYSCLGQPKSYALHFHVS